MENERESDNFTMPMNNTGRDNDSTLMNITLDTIVSSVSLNMNKNSTSLLNGTEHLNTVIKVNGFNNHTLIVTALNILRNMLDNDSSFTYLRNGTINNEDCQEWTEAQHILFQLAHSFFILSFLAPKTFRYHTLFLRCLASIASLIVIFWAAIVICFPDYLGWHLAFLVINSIHIGYHLCTGYPAKFDPLIEEVYRKHFKPFHVTRMMFSDLLLQGDILQISNGDLYAVEEDTPCNDVLSLLLCGRFRASCENLFLHLIDPFQFLDSPEYEARPPFLSETQDYYQVTIVAVEDSKIISWPCDKLRIHLGNNPHLQAVFSCMLGKDITSKLYHIQEWLTKNEQLQLEQIDNAAARRSSLVDEIRTYNVQPVPNVGHHAKHDSLNVIPSAVHRTHKHEQGEGHWIRKYPKRISISESACETSV